MQYKRIVQRVGRVMKVVAVAVILGLAASKVVDLFTADPQVGHWRTQEARSAYERAYRDVLAGLPAPDVTREVKTDYGIVHALVWNGPDDAGAPVLLMPGRSSGAPMWAENLPSWIGQRTVIALDPIGDAGLSAQSMPLGEPADQGAWVSQAIDWLGMNTVHVVGHSFGGATATELALAHPEQVASLTLLEPIMAASGMPASIYFWSTIAALPTPQSWQDRALAEIGGTTTDDVAERSPMSVMISEATQGYTAALPMPRTLTDDQWRSLTMPVRLDIGGESALAGGPGAAERVTRLVSQAEVTVWPGGTHSLPMDEADALGRELLDFWDASEGR